MQKSKEQNFKKELPSGYKQACYIHAKNAKVGIIFNLIALAVLIVVIALAIISLHIADRQIPSFLEMGPLQLLSIYVVFIAITSAYVVLHELVHGIAYKALTGEKLTFGMSRSCAFCGVPHIYTYRKTALIAVVAPFAVFTLLFPKEKKSDSTGADYGSDSHGSFSDGYPGNFIFPVRDSGWKCPGNVIRTLSTDSTLYSGLRL